MSVRLFGPSKAHFRYCAAGCMCKSHFVISNVQPVKFPETSPDYIYDDKPDKYLIISNLILTFLCFLQAPYSNALFLYEGWPLCLHDQVVVHLAPISPLQLQPGDFYFQVAPFCDQSARIVVCSLLEEKELIIEVVEETPIPETSYPCIFSCSWLEEINRGRHGTPLSRCLLSTEKGVVRLPWEQVALPDFVDVPVCARSSMASAPPAHPLLVSFQTPFPQADSSPSILSPPLSPVKESTPKDYPVTIKNPISASSSHPSAFSVETRICPAKHGIAVSLCLVDSRTASSSKPIKAQVTESEPKPIGKTHTWDSTEGGPNTAIKTSTTAGISSPVPADVKECKDDVEQEKSTDTNIRWSAGQVPAEGEYIDVLQATMLFSRAQTVKEEKKKLEMQMQSNTRIKPQMQRYPQKCTQMQPQPQMQSFRSTQRQLPTAQTSSEAQSQAHMKFSAETQQPGHCRSTAAAPKRLGTAAEGRTPFAPHHSQSQSHHPDPNTLDDSQCVRTVRFSEKPCTPCMRRRQGGKGSRAQELRCRYRDSYQAAIQNPVTFGQKTEKDNMSAVMEEESECDDRLKLQDTNTRDPWFSIQGKWFDPGIQTQFASSDSGDICKESGEKNTVPCWKAEDKSTPPCIDYRENNVSKTGRMPEKTSERINMPFREPRDSHSAKTYGNFPSNNVNGSNSALGPSFNSTRALSSSNVPQQSDVISTPHHMVPTGASQGSDTKMNLKPHKRQQNRNNSMRADPSLSESQSAPASRPESTLDGRCSSLSTAVVDTSEKCELVIVEGQNCRRREAKDFCPELPQLHVVKCKHSTAFRLVSPKINRKNKVVAGTGTL